MNKEQFIIDVRLRLTGFGYPVSNIPGASDDNFLEFSYNKVMNQIRHRINLTTIPRGLYEIAVDWVVGEFLFTKDSLGLLTPATGDVPDVGSSIASIKEGDTTVTYGSSDAETSATSPALKFANFLDYLRRGASTDFTHYRKMLW